MTRTIALAGLIGSAVLLPALALAGPQDISGEARSVMERSFSAKGQAGMDRLEQDEVQQACSRTPDAEPLSMEEEDRLMAREAAAIRYPADDNFAGDWKEGEKIAQYGRGLQFSDDPAARVGGNCYACHQLSKTEVAYGTIGPSLHQYGALRGNDPETVRNTYAKIYNPQATMPCSNMPRFGHKGILTQEQIRHLVALLHDPASPVNAE